MAINDAHYSHAAHENPCVDTSRQNGERQRYYADVPMDLLEQQSDLIDHLIDFAFDTLGAHSLEVRVRRAE